MGFIGDDHTFSLPCPGCGEKTEKTLGWFKTHPDSFECSGCGSTVHLDPDEVRDFIKPFDTVNKAVEDLGRTFDEINKRGKRGK